MEKDTETTLDSAILEETQAFASSVLATKLPTAIVFHTLENTKKVVKTAKKIGLKSELTELQLEMLLVAAWLHDIGYGYDSLNPVTESVKVAKTYLAEKNYPPEQIQVIIGCIAATKNPQSPKNILEKILCDADVAYLAAKSYQEKTELLRKETALLEDKEITPKEWLVRNLELLQTHQFFTTYGRLKLQDKQVKNSTIISQQLQVMNGKAKPEEYKKLNEPAKNSSGKDKDKPSRGIETMFRTTSHNHLELSAIADNKANIMITVNSISISLVISILIRRLEELPNLVIPTAILTVVCLLTIVFAVLATRPVITMGRFSREDILSKNTNLLFFGNFHKMPLEEYEWGMNQVMKDKDLLYSNLTHDIYYMGRVLGRKYHLLRLCYNIFMFGIILSSFAYFVALVFFPVHR